MEKKKGANFKKAMDELLGAPTVGAETSNEAPCQVDLKTYVTLSAVPQCLRTVS